MMKYLPANLLLSVSILKNSLEESKLIKEGISLPSADTALIIIFRLQFV